MLRSRLDPGVYMKPGNSGLGGVAGPYVIFAIDEREVKAAVKRTKSRRSRLAKLSGHIQQQKDIIGSAHCGAIPFTHMVVMRAIDPHWPKGDKRLIPALKSGNIRIHYIKIGDVVLGPGGTGVTRMPDGSLSRVREQAGFAPVISGV